MDAVCTLGLLNVQSNTIKLVIKPGWMDGLIAGLDALTLVGDNRMLLSTTVCWCDVRLLGQTHR